MQIMSIVNDHDQATEKACQEGIPAPMRPIARPVEPAQLGHPFLTVPFSMGFKDQ